MRPTWTPADGGPRWRRQGYIVGRLRRTIFYEPGVKETDWSATDVVRGVDGVDRRWVYLHYFKEGQPTLNWLDPTFAAPRLVIGDALHSLDVLGASMLRLDANGFLGVERRAGGPAWSEGHPLSITANQLIAGHGAQGRRLHLPGTQPHRRRHRGYVPRRRRPGLRLHHAPACQHALVTGQHRVSAPDAARDARRHGIDPAALVHALQNHDELTLELCISGRCTRTTRSPTAGAPGPAASCATTSARRCTAAHRAGNALQPALRDQRRGLHQRQRWPRLRWASHLDT
jgi:trehalose synthase